jgi:hypothetical protein
MSFSSSLTEWKKRRELKDHPFFLSSSEMRRFLVRANAPALLTWRRAATSPAAVSGKSVQLVTGKGTNNFYVTDEALVEAKLQTLLSSGAYIKEKKDSARRRVDSLTQQIARLTPTKELIDAKVLRSSTTFLVSNLAFLSAQFAILFKWVFFTFDWNLVEPVTYFLGYTVVWAGIVFYCQTGRNFTYDDIVEVLEDRRRAKLCAKLKFDYDMYMALVQELEQAKEELQHQ